MTTTPDQVSATTDEPEPHELRRHFGPIGLVSLGIGGIIGAGIFVITGQAAAEYAGPGIVISFAIAGVGCLFAALCYAELASMIPVSGSAYTYGYATLGRFIGWVIGWDLVLEYLAAGSTVAVGWSGYFASFMQSIGFPIRDALTSAPLTLDSAGHIILSGAILNVPAIVIILLMGAALIVGVRSSATFNNVMVLLKLSIVALVILFGLPLIKAENLTPFIPPPGPKFGEFGWGGILRASGVIFFAYIGFDAVSVAAQETKNPQRAMPIGILGSLLVCTVLYMLMALTMTGLTPYWTLEVPDPAYQAVLAAPSLSWLAPFVSIGAIVGLASVILLSLYGQSRIFYSMARDGLLPKVFSSIHPRYHTPWLGTLITCVVASILAGLLPLNILGELVSIGTLLAFVIVCTGVLILRRTHPNAKRPFRVPFSPVVPILGIIVCGLMMYWLPLDTWLRLIIWFAIGLVIWFGYGRHRAHTPRWKLDE